MFPPSTCSRGWPLRRLGEGRTGSRLPPSFRKLTHRIRGCECERRSGPGSSAVGWCFLPGRWSSCWWQFWGQKLPCFELSQLSLLFPINTKALQKALIRIYTPNRGFRGFCFFEQLHYAWLRLQSALLQHWPSGTQQLFQVDDETMMWLHWKPISHLSDPAPLILSPLDP